MKADTDPFSSAFIYGLHSEWKRIVAPEEI